MQFIQKNWKNLIIIILFLIATISTCRNINRTDCQTVSSDTLTTSHTDTFWVKQDTIRLKSTTPIAKTIIQPNKALIASLAHDTTFCDSVEVAYYTKKTYDDDITLKDSSGKSVGTVNILEDVTENTLSNRRTSYQLTFPKIVTTNTTTITNTVAQKPHNKYYLGAELMGTKDDIVDIASLKLLIQNKKDLMFGVSIGTTLSTTPKTQFGLNFYKKL